MNEYLEFKEQLEKLKLNNKKPTLLLHSCCGPCSSYVLMLLNEYFDITILYYNPNIYPDEEYYIRLNEQQKVIDIVDKSIKLISVYEPYSVYEEAIKGYEHLGELSKRCYNCYMFRMKKLAKFAKENKFDYFTTTLSISPYKSSKWINEIGMSLDSENTKYLYSNFKKEDGYKKSIAFCKEYNIYRQDYCGCKYSIEEHNERIRQKEQN